MPAPPERRAKQGGVPAPSRRSDGTGLAVRYLLGLLWFQGIVWALLAEVGLAAWAEDLAAALAAHRLGSSATSLGVGLMMIIGAAGCAIGEITLARRLRGSRKLLVAAAIGTETCMLCFGVVVAGVLLMAGAGLASLVAFGGPALSLVGLMVLSDEPVRRRLAPGRPAGPATCG